MPEPHLLCVFASTCTCRCVKPWVLRSDVNLKCQSLPVFETSFLFDLEISWDFLLHLPPHCRSPRIIRVLGSYELSCLHGKHHYPLNHFLSFNNWYFSPRTWVCVCVFVFLFVFVWWFWDLSFISSGWLWTNSKPPASPFYASVTQMWTTMLWLSLHI